jgi:hypothetical protein
VLICRTPLSTRATAAVAVGLLAAVSLTACGSDEAKTLTSAEFAAQGNAICEAGNERITKISDDAGVEGEPTDDQIVELAGLILDDIEVQVDDIAELAAPDEISDDVDEFVTQTKSIIGDLRKDESLITSATNPFEATNSIAVKIGLDACAG